MKKNICNDSHPIWYLSEIYHHRFGEFVIVKKCLKCSEIVIERKRILTGKIIFSGGNLLINTRRVDASYEEVKQTYEMLLEENARTAEKRLMQIYNKNRGYKPQSDIYYLNNSSRGQNIYNNNNNSSNQFAIKHQRELVKTYNKAA